MVFLSRRSFVKGSGAAALAPWFQSVKVEPGHTLQSYYAREAEGFPDRAHLRALTTRAIDAARSAGAEYADVRITQQHWTLLTSESDGDSGRLNFQTRVTYGVGVRSLVRGCWGYASHTTWSLDDISRLAIESTGAARAGAIGTKRTVSLAPVIPVPDGDWATPIRINPYGIAIDEIMDELFALAHQPFQLRPDVNNASLRMELTREYRVFASSDGTFTTQMLYRTGGNYGITMKPHWQTRLTGFRSADVLSIAGAGWEYVLDLPLRAEIPRLLDEADRLRVPKDVNIGRYDVVFDAKATAAILSESLGPATDLTRAMGYDANADGTSFLDDPQQMVGTLKVAAPSVTITANRSMPGGTSTVKWDDEGVVPNDFTIVKDGLLTDFQTTRESSAWLADYYNRKGRAIQSHGCTGSDSAIEMTGPQAPNFVVAPGSGSADRADLCKGIDLGYLVLGGTAKMDHQCISGVMTSPVVFEIRNGVVGDAVAGAGFLLNTMEFWKNVDALGGPASVGTFNTEFGKSYKQRSHRSVQTPPIRVKNVATMDMRRRRF